MKKKYEKKFEFLVLVVVTQKSFKDLMINMGSEHLNFSLNIIFFLNHLNASTFLQIISKNSVRKIINFLSTSGICMGESSKFLKS